jgi:hypothetical protein
MVLGFSSGPIRMVFMLFDPLTAKAINFLRDGSGRIWRPWVGLASLGWSCVLGLVLRPWVGLASLGWSDCFVSSGPIRMVFVLFYPLTAKVINFLDFAGRVSFSFRWHFLS